MNTNLLAVQKVLKFTDILAVQEHWLFNFEQQKIGQLDVAFSYAAKSVDDEDPISPFQRRRGYGGVAILWRKKIDDKVKLLPDGSSRIICLELKVNCKKICIINLYMPCRGRPEAEADFQDSLDEINEIIEKYHHSHSIILMGDLNASLNREPPYPRDKALRGFCISNNICTDMPKVTTFYHSNGRDVSQIDYILTTKEDKEIACSNEKTPHPDILDQNVSDHEPVFGSINIPNVNVNSNNTGTRSIDRYQGVKTNWDKIDKDKYKRLLDERITPRLIKSNEDLDHVIQELNDVMILTSKECLLKPDRKAKRSSKGLDIWSPSISNLVKLNKKAHFMWKEAGRPKDTHHPDNVRRKNSKRALRSAIRRANRNIKDHHLQEISSAHSKDTKLFHKLIKAQRAESTNFTNPLIINDDKLTDPDEICSGFKDHFCKLADNLSTEGFSSIEETASIRLPIIHDLCKNGENATPVEVDEVKKLIISFKNGKSQDPSHITAEHLKYTGENMLLLLTNIINYMLTSTYIPDELMRGILTPILKKKKDKTRPDNYRGITVTSVIGKLLEKAWLLKADPILSKIQNPMQRGFTKLNSPSNAALLVTESINEAKENKKPVYVTLLDVSKAFDVVDHSILLEELYLAGVSGNLWLTFKQLYHNPSTAVKWNGFLSDSFKVKQGVRQGGVTSAPIYKVYTNRLLDQLTEHHTGHRIGTVKVPAPTCADDMAILSNAQTDTQMALNIVENYSKSHKYKINASKSATVPYSSLHFFCLH